MPKKFFDIVPPKKIEKKIEIERPIKYRASIPILQKSTFKKGLIITLATLISIGFFCFLTLSKAEIEIWLETEVLNFKEKITIDSRVNQSDFGAKVISGEIFELEKSFSQEFPSSSKILKEEKAKGQIRVFNNYHLAQTLVVNTRFQPPLEKVLYFRSKKTIFLPAKGHIDIEVIADQPGEEYNIEPSTFSIPGLFGLPQYYSVYGKSSSPMTGGFKGETFKVTEEDLERAKNTLVEKLFTETKESLKNKIGGDFILLDETLKEKIVDTSSSVEAGAEAQSFNFQVRIKSKALVFKKPDLGYFAEQFILSRLPQDKKFQEDSLKIDYSLESIDWESEKISLNLEFSAKIYSDIDVISLKRALRGKLLAETQVHLEDQPKITRVRLKFWPFWVKTTPEDIEKIEIKLNLD
ncbi:hypothetical protein KJA15_00650 [Patescibacteria group bacterium]|nr:hypothetical protein [Patescibacteria group bacterium]